MANAFRDRLRDPMEWDLDAATSFALIQCLLAATCFCYFILAFVYSQAYLYAIGIGRNDRRVFQCLAVFLVVATTGQVGILTAETVSAINDGFDFVVLNLKPSWYLIMTRIVCIGTGLAGQGFFVYQCIKISKSKVWMAVGLILFNVGGMCFGTIAFLSIVVRSKPQYYKWLARLETTGFWLSAILSAWFGWTIFYKLNRKPRKGNGVPSKALERIRQSVVKTALGQILVCVGGAIGASFQNDKGNIVVLFFIYIYSPVAGLSILVALNLRARREEDEDSSDFDANHPATWRGDLARGSRVPPMPTKSIIQVYREQTVSVHEEFPEEADLGGGLVPNRRTSLRPKRPAFQRQHSELLELDTTALNDCIPTPLRPAVSFSGVADDRRNELRASV
ncbi:hypothetical protein T439DRAFT_324677 [Meredithblackwellia eburnea MCA 4105]